MYSRIKNHLRRGARLALSVSLVLPVSALAEDQLDDRLHERLEPVVVSATRTRHPLDRTPAAVSVIDREDIEQRQATTLQQLLRDVPGVAVAGGARADAQVPAIRGFIGRQITLMVDGARRNADMGGIATPLFIDPWLLQRVEVVRGATSSLFGSGGMGGTIVMNTVSAADLLEAGQAVGGSVSAGAQSAAHQRTYRGRVYGRHGAVDALAAFSADGVGPIRQGGGSTLAPNDGHTTSALLKFGWTPDYRLRLTLAQQYFDERNFRPNNPQADARFAYNRVNRSRQHDTTVNLAWANADGEKAVDALLYRSHMQTSIDADPDAKPPAVAHSSELDTVGASVQHTVSLGRRLVIPQQLTYGTDLYRDRQRGRDGAAMNTVEPDGHQDVLGLFAQDEMGLGARWTLTPSVRWDRYLTVAQGQPGASSDRRLSPKATLAFQARPTTMLYASYGGGFRVPSINEMYGQYAEPTGYANFSANPGLRPEVSSTWEGGIKYRAHGWLAAGDAVSARLSVYRADVRDLINMAIIGTFQNPYIGRRPVFQSQNVAQAKRWGVELDGDYRRGRWTAAAAFSHMRVTDKRTGRQLYSPPDSLSATVGYRFDHALSLTWAGTAAAPQQYDSTIARRRGGYLLQDIYLSWAPPRTDHLRVDVAVDNLFDKRYSAYKFAGSNGFILEQGRNVKLTLTALF